MYNQGKYVTVKNYPILKDRMSSFDLLMFRGDDIISDTIAEVQKQQQFTHTGLVINSELLPGYDLKPNHLYIFESTYSHEIMGIDNGPPDCITGKNFFGAQLRDLEILCNSYIRNDKTKIAWFELRNKPKVSNFSAIFKRHHQKPFLNQPFASMFNFNQITPEAMAMAKNMMTSALIQVIFQASFTCVHLVLTVYQELGLIASIPSILYPIDILGLGREPTKITS